MSEPTSESANGAASNRCEGLHAYVDGELNANDHAEFELHLSICDACDAELPRLLALLAAFDGAAEAAPGALPRAPHLTLVAGGADQNDHDEHNEHNEPPRDVAAPRPGKRHRSWWIATGLTGALAAAAALLLVLRPASAPVVASLQSELGPARHLEARLSYPGTGAYRPLDVTRGARAIEPISLDHRVALERAKDPHGLAVASLLAGEREAAARYFVEAGKTPAVDSDRAALELQDGSPAALERALDDVDRALAAAPNDPPALWNRALVLAALDLPLAAASEFDRVQAFGEPGWAGEARLRAEALRAQVAQRRTRWKQAFDAGQGLIEQAAPVPAELAAVTGTMTALLYTAVRTAPSRTAVETLLPLAKALDTAYRSDHLTTYVRRIATSDFRIRKPLADTYRELFRGRLADPAVDAFLKRLAETGTDDLRLGALAVTGRARSQLAEYRRLATASGDPWFVVTAEQETAEAERARGDVTAAERRLRGAIELAQRERLAYRVLLLRERLVQLYKSVHNLTQAAEEARVEYHEAIAAGEALVAMNALADLGAINQDRYADGLARAYLAEQLEGTQTTTATGPTPLDDDHACETRQYTYQSLANLALGSLAPDRARDFLARAPTCNKEFATALMLQRALVAAELYRLGHRGGDAVLAGESLAALRGETLSPGQHAMMDLISGILVIDADRAAGQRHLRDAIARADHLTDAANFPVKARAYGFALLALDAGRAGNFAQVIDLLAEDLELKRPARCTLAVAHYAERSVIAFSDAHGEIRGQYTASGTSADLDVSTLVPAAAADRLRACDRVDVLARAPVLGAGRLLPPDLAWSYLLKGATSSGTSPDASTAPKIAPSATGRLSAAAPTIGGRRLVIANPATPPDLALPPLGPYPDEPGGAVVVLRGADATPTHVLSAMRDVSINASVIEFHTHGFIGNDVSEASYLVLSPEFDRQYTLTATDVAQVKLEAAPLVILGACHAAASSRSLEGGMGLAEAFLRAGARAVVASPDAVQDLGAPAFFAAVRDRVIRGVDPAIALRDERVRRLAMSHDNAWVAGVVVFE